MNQVHFYFYRNKQFFNFIGLNNFFRNKDRKKRYVPANVHV